MTMKTKFAPLHILLWVLLSTLFIQNVSAQDRKYVTVPGDPLNARIYTLDNGLTVYMTVYKDEPRIQTYIATKAGSKNDPSDATGLAHYFEHMMFKGTGRIGTTDYSKEAPLIASVDSLFEVYRKISPDDKVNRDKVYRLIDSISTEASKYAIPNEYDKLLAYIGATGTNAYTSLEQTVYVNTIASNQLENWMLIESERFRQPVLRLFHTELETIYEEHNMTLTNDDVKMYFAMLKGLFLKHTYGTQTVIGTVEHLKSPSMKRVREFYNNYYVPNNMAICLSGDFDPDKVIVLIDKYFGDYPKKEVVPYKFEPEDPINEPRIINVVGPDAESVNIAFRLGGASTPDADLLPIFDMILANSAAGLIDLNLVQKQKVLSATSSAEVLMDYSFELLQGKPKEGQTLDQVKDLLLEQIDKIKKGEFDDWLLGAIITDLKLKQTKSFEKNESRAQAFVESFTTGQPWGKYVQKFDRYSKITKKDIIEFANKNFTNNYVLIYKKTGKEEVTEQKIKKPKITKIKINREDKSEFRQFIESKKIEDIEPVFLDYKKDITRYEQKNLEVYYLKNIENKTFNLYYVFEMGTNNDRILGVAIDYLQYLGTSDYTPAQIKQEFFKLGCSFDVYNSAEKVYVSLSGLTENIEKGIALFEKLLTDAQPNPEALSNLVKDKVKERADNKKNQQTIFSYMVMYGIFGPQSPVTNVLSEDELNKLTAQQLVDKIKNLHNFYHHILYYGSNTQTELRELIEKYHKVPAAFSPIPEAKVFPELATEKTVVYQVEYDMKQAMLFMLSQSDTYNKSNESVIKLYNEYFGGSMNAIVFQEMRESRALAYAAMSFYQNLLQKKESHYYNISFIMTQTDKLGEALKAFFELMDNMPDAEKSFDLAKSSILQSMRTERVTKSDILFNYESAKRLGLDYDIRQDIYKQIPELKFADVKAFQEKYVKGKPQVILVLGPEKSLDFKMLKKYGKVKKLKLKEVFGY